MGEPYREIMTVARVYEPADEWVRVAFLESARFYRVLKSNPAFEDILATLKQGSSAEVGLESITSDVIESVKAV